MPAVTQSVNMINFHTRNMHVQIIIDRCTCFELTARGNAKPPAENSAKTRSNGQTLKCSNLQTSLLEEVSACATFLRIISVLITGYEYNISSQISYGNNLSEQRSIHASVNAVCFNAAAGELCLLME